MAVQIDVRANSEQAQRSLEKLNNSVKNIEVSADSVNSSLRSLNRAAQFAATAITAAFTGSVITRAADSYKRINTQLRLATLNAKGLVAAQQNVNRIAIQTRNNIEGTAVLYARLNKSAIQLNKSQAQTAKATRAISQAIQISGASAASAQAAIIQLGQGLASGTLRGEELNSVLEQTPRIAKALADELNISVGQLRKIASEGKLTSEVVFNALVNQSAKINSEFSQVSVTVGQALSVFNTGASNFLASLDKAVGLSDSLAKRIIIVGEALNDFGATFEDRVTILEARLTLFRIQLLRSFRTTFAKITDSLKNITFENITFDVSSNAYTNATKKISEIETKLKSLTGFNIKIDFSAIESSINTVKSFTKEIYNYFEDLYIKLVGNSIIPDMVFAIIDWMLTLKAETLPVIEDWKKEFVGKIEELYSKSVRGLGDFVYATKTQLESLKENSFIKKGFDVVEKSLDRIKASDAFISVNSALSEAKNKALEVGNTLKDSFKTTFTFDDDTVSTLTGSFGLALTAATLSPDLINAFRTLFDNSLALVKPIAILTLSEKFGSDIARVLKEKVDFESLGESIGTAFRNIVSGAGSSGTADLGAQLGASFLNFIQGGLKGAVFDAEFTDALTVALSGVFVAAVASKGFRSALLASLSFSFTGASITDKIGPLGKGRDVNTDIIGEQRAASIQRVIAGSTAIAGSLFAAQVSEELGGSAADQIAAAIVGGMLGGVAGALLGRIGASIALGISSTLATISAAAGLTAAGGIIAGGILTVLTGLGGLLLFPEETQLLVKSVFGEAAANFVKELSNTLRTFTQEVGQSIGDAFKEVLKFFGIEKDKAKLTDQTISQREAFEKAIDNLRVSELVRVDDALLSNVLTLLSNNNNTNQELGVLIRQQAALAKETLTTNTLNALASEIEKLPSKVKETNDSWLDDFSKSVKEIFSSEDSAVLNQRVKPSVEIGNDLREKSLITLKSLDAVTSKREDPRELVKNAISILEKGEKNAFEIANALEKFNTRNDEINKTFKSIAELFRQDALRSLQARREEDAARARARAEEGKRKIAGFANGGRVWGSGTGKSDSIPAYLSNGEYVVNAKATARNLGTLSAINGGMNVGGQVGRYENGGLAKIIQNVLKHEGGKSNNKLDRGGKTNFGITQSVWTAEGNKGDVFDISKEDAIKFYKHLWQKSKIYRFNEELQAQLFDIIINSGYGNAANMFQRALNIRTASGQLAQTSGFGTKTIAAINRLSNNQMVNIRLGYFDDIVKNDPDQKEFLKGWRNRAKSFRMATGGKVVGPGTGRSDSIPAMLSNGEFVVNASATSRNRGLLESINRTGFKNGGVAGVSSENLLTDGTSEVVEGIKDLTNETVTYSQFAQLGKTETNIVKQSLKAIELINNDMINASASESAELLLQVENLKGVISKYLSTVTGADGDQASGVTQKSFAEKVMESVDFNEAGAVAGRDFVNTLRVAIIEGEGGGIKSILRGFVDSFTAKVVDQFFDGLSTQFADLFSADGPLDLNDAFKNIGESLKGLFGEGGTLTSLLGGLGNSISGIFSSISGMMGGGGGGGLGSIISTIGGFFGGGASASSVIPSLITPFATGGMVAGPIGGEVPALVHGGEMILNPTQQQALFSNKKANGNSNNVSVNLQITGDVSAQTRKEVMKLLPEIADSTQYTFRERGII